MKQTRHQDLQRQITNLVSIIEMYIPLLEQVEKSKLKLDILPAELKNLKQQLNLLETRSYLETLHHSSDRIQETESKLDFLVDDLEEILVHLTAVDRQVKNLFALRERLEAVQEERISGITPERIYKLIAKQQLPRSAEEEPVPTSRVKHWKQNIANRAPKFGSKILLISFAMIVSLSCGWIVGSYSTVESNNNSLVKEYK